MCGLTGFINLKNDKSACEDHLRAMNSALTHRGPNDEGYWIDPPRILGMAHRRLSILDLSRHGHQPMFSASNRFVIAFNGEVYNFLKLRKQLTSVQWRGHSDTEVILAIIDQWGIEDAVKKFVGMFAFALWDKKERLLHLVRDRLGIKPLYYGWQGNSFLFGSELKALKSHPEFRGVIDRNSLSLFIRYNHIPAPFSIYEGINKLLPATFSAFPQIIPNKLSLRFPIGLPRIPWSRELMNPLPVRRRRRSNNLRPFWRMPSNCGWCQMCLWEPFYPVVSIHPQWPH